MRRATELRECVFVQLAPDLARRFPDDPPKCTTAVAQLHHEQPWPAIFSGLRVPRERTLAVVDLRFLPGISLKPATDFPFGRSQFADETFDRVVRAVVAVVLDQILVDRDRVTALGGLRLDEAPMRLAGAARRRQVGGHFWYTLRLGGKLAGDAPDRRSVEAGLSCDPPLRPSEAQQTDDCLSLVHAQSVHKRHLATPPWHARAGSPHGWYTFKWPPTPGTFSTGHRWYILGGHRGEKSTTATDNV